MHIVGERQGNRLGDMRHRITVKKVTETFDDSRQPVVTWSNRYVGEPAKFKQVRGGEVIRGRQIEPEVTAVFTVNYRSEYKETDRIVFQGDNYGIVRLDKPDGIGRFLDIYCKMVP